MTEQIFYGDPLIGTNKVDEVIGFLHDNKLLNKTIECSNEQCINDEGKKINLIFFLALNGSFQHFQATVHFCLSSAGD